MFEGANQAALGHIAGVNAQHGRMVDNAMRRYDELARWYDQLKARADRLERENADLRLALAVKESTDEADQVLLAQWREAHPTSPMRQAVGKLKNGSPLSRGLSVWIKAFDEAARKRGITNPEAHRIS